MDPPSADDASLLSHLSHLRLRHPHSSSSSSAAAAASRRRPSHPLSALSSRHRAVAPADFHETPPPAAPHRPLHSPKHDDFSPQNLPVPSSGSGSGGGRLLSTALACLCRPKQSLASLASASSSSPSPAVTASALLHQSRLQLQALETLEETRDMWEWQMEQQHSLARHEHQFLEKQYSSGAAAAAFFQSPLISLARSSSARRHTPDSSSASAAARRRRRDPAGSLHSDDFSRAFPVVAFGGDGPDPVAEVGGGDECRQRRRADPVAEEASVDDSLSPAPPYPSPAAPTDRMSFSAAVAAAPPDSPPFDLCRHLSDPDYAAAVSVLFEGTLLRCRSEINLFCRIYMQQMVLSGYSLVKTLMEMEPETVFVHRVHASYALESRICSVMFRCFENDSFDDTGLTQILDQDARAATRLHEFFAMKAVEAEAALAMGGAAYDAGFHHFCAAKSEEIAEMGGGWRMSYRSSAERDRFMEAFLRAAKCVWMLHRLANATNPPMHIIRVARGMNLHPLYVEPAALLPAARRPCPACSAGVTGVSAAAPPKVQFMVMPGFVSPNAIFKALVYPHYRCPSATSSSSSSPAAAGASSSTCSS